MARTKGSKNTVHSKKAAVDYAAIVEEKAAAKNKLNQKSKDCPKILAH